MFKKLFDNPSKVWFITGCVGFAGTIASTIVAVRNYDLAIDNLKDTKQLVTKEDKMKTIARCSIVPAASAILSLYSFSKSKNIDAKTITALTAGYGFWESNYRSLANAVNDKMGIEDGKVLINQAKIDNCNSIQRPDVYPIQMTKTGTFLCEDEWSHTQMFLSMDIVDAAEEKLLGVLNTSKVPITMVDIWTELGMLPYVSEQAKVSGMYYGVNPDPTRVIRELFDRIGDVDAINRCPKLILSVDLEKLGGTKYGN